MSKFQENVHIPLFALKLPIQTSLSVASELPVSLRSHEKFPNFRKTGILHRSAIWGFHKLNEIGNNAKIGIEASTMCKQQQLKKFSGKMLPQ